MPKTKFQDIIFTLIMVVVMVYALVVYNISLDLSLIHICRYRIREWIRGQCSHSFTGDRGKRKRQ